MANRTKLATLILGAALMIGVGATASFAEGDKCGAGKCGGKKSEKAAKCGGDKGKKAEKAGKCGGEMSEKAGKCGGDKAKKKAKCGAGKCGM